MENLKVGDNVFIQVETSDGAFLGEYLISFETLDGPVSGFIDSSRIKSVQETQVIEARVEGIDSDGIAVRLPGSFFTTTGLAHISPKAPLLHAA